MPYTRQLQRVYVNSRNAMRAGDVSADSAAAWPLNHPLWLFLVLIAGSATRVHQSASRRARLQSGDGLRLRPAARNTFIGGPTGVGVPVRPEEWLHTGLEGVGLVVCRRVLLAAMAVAALVSYAIVLMMGGLVSATPASVRSRYRDSFQGVAGMAFCWASLKSPPVVVRQQDLPKPRNDAPTWNNKFGQTGNL